MPAHRLLNARWVATHVLVVVVAGVFVALIYASSMGCGLVSGALVRRWGALRLSQVCLVAACAGVGLLASAHVVGIAAAAVLMGIGYGPLNPASSHLLNRVAPPHHRSRIFSLKQTGVPVGALLAGALLPPLASWSGWRSPRRSRWRRATCSWSCAHGRLSMCSH